MPTLYSPLPSLDDDYRCFLIDWPETGTQYITGFEVHPDNATMVHHVAAFLVRPDTLAGPEALDAFRAFADADAEAGYTRFGCPSSAEETQVPVQQIAQWVPRNGAILFPEKTRGSSSQKAASWCCRCTTTLAWDGQPDQTTADVVISNTVDRIGAHVEAKLHLRQPDRRGGELGRGHRRGDVWRTCSSRLGDPGDPQV